MICATNPECALRLKEVTSELDFMRLRGPWNQLVERIGANVFLRHEWFTAAMAWLSTTDRRIWIVCVFAGERLVGVLPLLKPYGKSNGVRQLEFITVPDTQWCDGLLDPDLASSVALAFVGWLRDNVSGWDVIRLERLKCISGVGQWLVPALKMNGMQVHQAVVDQNPVVNIDSPWQGYESALSRKLKKTRNLATNRASRVGGVQFQRTTARTATQDQIQQLLVDVVDVSSRSWKRTTGSSLDQPGPLAFIRTLTEVALTEQWLSIWMMRIAGRPVAMEYQLVYGVEVHALRADYDTCFANISPGTQLNFHMLKALFEDDDLHLYYMGPGKNHYKARWKIASEDVCTVTSFSPTVRGQACALWALTKPKLQRFKEYLSQKN